MNAPVVYIHVGAPKTGTTFLQELMWTNRAALLKAGVMYPGGAPAAQFFAAQDLLNAAYHGHRDPRLDGAWERLVRAVRTGPDVAVFSHETLSLALPEDVERAMTDLAFAAEVHVVFTVRDLVRQIPSVWQEDVKNRHAVPFRRFVRSLEGSDPDPTPMAALFWRFQDPVSILGRWGAALPPERVHVVTVPPPGAPSGLLWQRFAATVGLDPEMEIVLPRPANQSLGVVEANVLRRLNGRLGEHFDWPTYERWVKSTLAGTVLGRRPDQISLRLPAEEYGWASQWALRTGAALEAAGYDVVGDLSDIVPGDPSGAPTRHPDSATPAEMNEATLDALAALIATMAGAVPAAAPDVAAEDDAPAAGELPAAELFKLGLHKLRRTHPEVERAYAVYSRARSAYAATRSTAARALARRRAR